MSVFPALFFDDQFRDVFSNHAFVWILVTVHYDDEISIDLVSLI